LPFNVTSSDNAKEKSIPNRFNIEGQVSLNDLSLQLLIIDLLLFSCFGNKHFSQG